MREYIKTHRKPAIIIGVALLVLIVAGIVLTVVLIKNTSGTKTNPTSNPGISSPVKTEPATSPGSTPTPTTAPEASSEAYRSTQGVYTITQLARATTYATLGYNNYCTYTKGINAKNHLATYSVFYAKSTLANLTYNKNIATQTCQLLYTKILGIDSQKRLAITASYQQSTVSKTGKKATTVIVVTTRSTSKNNQWVTSNIVIEPQKK